MSFTCTHILPLLSEKNKPWLLSLVRCWAALLFPAGSAIVTNPFPCTLIFRALFTNIVTTLWPKLTAIASLVLAHCSSQAPIKLFRSHLEWQGFSNNIKVLLLTLEPLCCSYICVHFYCSFCTHPHPPSFHHWWDVTSGQAAGFPCRAVIQCIAGGAFRGKYRSWKSSFQKNKQRFWLVSHIVILPASFVFQMGEIKVNNPRATIWFERNVISEREICKNSHNQEMRNILRNWQFKLIFHVVYLLELVIFYHPRKYTDNPVLFFFVAL